MINHLQNKKKTNSKSIFSQGNVQRVSSYQPGILNKRSTCFLFLSVIVVFNVGKLKITIYLNLTGT